MNLRQILINNDIEWFEAFEFIASPVMVENDLELK